MSSNKLTNNSIITAKNSTNEKFEFTDQYIFEQARIGFEFEFLTKLEDKTIVKSLGKFLNKKIIIPEEVTKLNTIAIPNHSAFNPTDKEFKLERDFSGGLTMFEMITGPLEYLEAKEILEKFLTWLSKNGYTNKKTSIHINLSFKNPKTLNLKNTIQNLNRIKMCLDFDEEFVYQRFPNRRNNVYARTIKTFYPTFDYILPTNIHPNNFLTPATKYFGVNFLKQEKNYLEFRYLGGEGYEKKFKEILECSQHFIKSLYNVLNDPFLSEKNIKEFEKIVKPICDISESVNNFDRFIFNYPKILLLVDLENNFQKIKTFFHSVFKKYILEFILNGGLKEGIINYDSSYGKIQIKDAKLKNIVKSEDIEFFDCDIDGALVDHNLYYKCKIKNGIIGKSIFNSCDIKGCKINKVESNYLTTFDDCYIENKKLEYSGYFKNSIIRYDKPDQISKLENCLFIADALQELEKKQTKKDIENPKDLYKEFQRGVKK